MMKITRSQLKRIIFETMEKSAEDLLKGIDFGGAAKPPPKSVIYVDETPYGYVVTDSKGDYKSLGQMILTLIEAGQKDIFNTPNDEKSLEKLLEKHRQRVQGGIQRWDPDVFSQYYNVDVLRSIQMYADMFDLNIVYLEPEENYY